MKSKQQGFTVIELIISLGVIAILGGAILKFGGGLMGSSRAKVASDFIGMIISTSRPLKSAGTGYAGLSSSVIANYIDEGFVTSGSIVNTYGGAVTITPVTYGGISNNALSISEGLYPEQDCNKTVNAIGDSMVSVVVNGTTVKAAGGTLNKTTLGTACNATTSTIVWTFS